MDATPPSPEFTPRRRKRRHLFGPRAMAIVVDALEQGAAVPAAAKAAGFGKSTLYVWRAKSPGFRAAWDDAVEASARPMLIARRGARGYRLQRVRRRLFGRALKARFLERFGATGCATRAARDAGIGRSTAYKHRDLDPAFAAAWAETEAQVAIWLEAELLRQRIEAGERLRVAAVVPEIEEAREFDRAMQLLREHKRSLAGERKAGRPLTKWSFEDAFADLERRLVVYGARRRRGE